jgi:hypothetical protein
MNLDLLPGLRTLGGQPGRALYYDQGHLKTQGNQIVAFLIADQLIKGHSG